MSLRNSYATLAEFKAYITARGQTATTDAGDDAVIEKLLEAASRYIDQESREQFYPTIETRLFDVPGGSRLYTDKSLLEVLTLTNGDATVIAGSSYFLIPGSIYPKFAIDLKQSGSVFWQLGSGGEPQQAISLSAIWGYHDRYSAEGWKAGSTLSEALDTSELGFDVADSALFAAGGIIKIDSEINTIASIATNTLTVLVRGDNGSTAATHTSGTSVYYWSPMEGARNAAIEIANTAYGRRFGRALGATETITAAGVIISPRDVPAMASDFIRAYGRKLI
jgi:hypothetical protein